MSDGFRAACTPCWWIKQKVTAEKGEARKPPPSVLTQDTGDRQDGVDETHQGILVEGAGRLLRLLRQMPNRRHRWICSDALNQVSCCMIRIAIRATWD